jgi:hypothetical protein
MDNDLHCRYTQEGAAFLVSLQDVWCLVVVLNKAGHRVERKTSREEKISLGHGFAGTELSI